MMGSPFGSSATIWMLTVELTLQRITVGCVTMGGMLPSRQQTDHNVEYRSMVYKTKNIPKQCSHLTIDQSQILILCLGVQSLQAQVRAARCYGVMDALHAAFTGSPQLLHLSRTDAFQQLLSGGRCQRNQRRLREQQALWDGNCP